MPNRPKRKAVSNTQEIAKRARGETNLKWDLTWEQVPTFTELAVTVKV